jgi:hypothetical protein
LKLVPQLGEHPIMEDQTPSGGRNWTRKGIDAAAYAALSKGLAASELWSLLLGVLEERTLQRVPAEVRQQWQRDRFVVPAPLDQRTFNALDAHLLSAASAFDALELSPLAPLAACSAIALTSQNRTVSTIRGTEVVSDPTNLLALESAARLAKDPHRVVKLATSHRCVRAQPFPDKPGFAAHFRLFVLTTAGHERKDHGLLVEALAEHIRTHLCAMDRLEQHGYAFSRRAVRLLTTPERQSAAKRVVLALPDTPISVETLAHDYYAGLRFMISARTAAGEDIPFIDGGAFDWMQKLTSNAKHVFVASGMGSQIAAYWFRVKTQAQQT